MPITKSSTKAVAAPVSAEVMQQLRDSYPVEAGALRIQLPRLGMVSQDITEEEGKGKNKTIKVVTPAGEFFTEVQTDEKEEVEDKDGNVTEKSVWKKAELGSSIEGIILFQRRQLRYFDEGTQLYTSSPVFDTDEDVIPLFCNKQQVDRGLPRELKAKYMTTDSEGKEKSKLEENRILYVLYGDELYQMNLRGSSMYSFLSYARKTVPNTVVTIFGSESKEKGKIAWNQMTFMARREINAEEAQIVLEKLAYIKTAVEAERVSANALASKDKKDDAEMDELANAGKTAPAQIAAPRKKF